MRLLVALRERDFVDLYDTGALGGLERFETYHVSTPLKDSSSVDLVAGLPRYLGSIDHSKAVVAGYRELERISAAAGRFRSVGLEDVTRNLPPRERRRAKLAALPGMRSLTIPRVLRRLGLDEDLYTLMKRVAPDLVIGGNLWDNTIGFDAIRAARALGIKSLMLLTHWDSVSFCGGFEFSDYLAVWGQQSIDHAERIHSYPRERALALGSPRFQFHFDRVHNDSDSPFPFRYVLFTGTHARWDEVTPLEHLNAQIDELGLDLKIVYRPYPGRSPRDRPDFVDEDRLRNVVIDPTVREAYMATFGGPKGKQTRDLRWLTPLLANAEFLVSPITTLMLEGALFDKRVLVLGYEDGLHTDYRQADFLRYEILEGIENVFALARSSDEMAQQFGQFARMSPLSDGALRRNDTLRWWLHNDERSYSDRLVSAVETIVAEGSVRRQ